MEILKVSSHSSPNSVAGAIAGVIREQKAVEVQAVGAGASNQAVKAIAIARGYLAPIGIDLICIPAFANIQIDGEEKKNLTVTDLLEKFSVSSGSEFSSDRGLLG